jgi:tetratricopeptide (TPR) repeat protein
MWPNTATSWPEATTTWGIVFHELGKQAEAAFHRAIALYQRLADDFPGIPDYRAELAGGYSDLGNFLRRQRRYGDAEEAYRQALELKEKLAAESATYGPVLARTRSHLGQVLREQARYAEAEELYHQALPVQQKLVDEFPALRGGRVDLADTYNGLGIVLTELRKPAEAEAAFRHSLDLRKKLADDFPKVLLYRRNFAYAYNDLGSVLKRQSRYPEAEDAYRQALDLKEKLVAESGTVPGYRQDLARGYANLGNLLLDLKKYAEAEASYRRALAHHTQLVDEFSEVANYRLDRADTQFRLGQVFRVQHRPVEALPWYNQALAELQPLHQAAPTDVAIRTLRGHVCWDRARTLNALQRSAEALVDWDHAVDLLPPADRLRVRSGRARAWVQAGKTAEAVAEATAVTKDPGTPSARCCEAACVYALASAAVEETGRREVYAGEALALLRRAQAAGFFKDPPKIAHLNQDTDLAPLRARADFQNFVAELEAAAKP